MKQKIVILVILIAGALGALIAGISIYLPVEDDIQKADAIVAISGGDTDARVKKAIALYKEGWAPRLIFSGAAKDPRSPSNAKVMRQTALDSGVPASVISIDEAAENTQANASGVKLQLKETDKTIILVTSQYHQRRAAKVFSKEVNKDVAIINQPAKDGRWNRKTWFLTPFGWWISITETIKFIVS